MTWNVYLSEVKTYLSEQIIAVPRISDDSPSPKANPIRWQSWLAYEGE